MTVNSTGNVRSTGRLGEDLGADAEFQELKKKLVLGDSFGRGDPSAVKGMNVKAPALPGGGDPNAIARQALNLTLEALGLGSDAMSSKDPEVQKAVGAVRRALGMDETAPMTGQTMESALKKKEPELLEALKELGLTPGKDLNDPATKDAIKQVQQAMGRDDATGDLDLETLMAIIEAKNNQRNQNAQRTSRSGGNGSNGGSGGNMGGGGAGNLASNMPQRTPPGEPQRSTMDKVKDFAHDKMGIGPGSAPTGTLKANQKEAYDAAIKEGLSPMAAKALVANMTGESLAKPNDHHWDVKHMSQGIVQWDPNRAAAIQKEFGKLPKDMTVAEQTKAAIWEMKNKYPKTYEALQGSDPQQMMRMLVKDYERPASPEAQIAKRMQFYNNLGHLG